MNYNLKLEIWNLPAGRSESLHSEFKSIFNDIDSVIEKYGDGIKRIANTFLDEGLTIPVFENYQHGFRVTVFSAAHQNVVENVVENETAVLEEILQNKKISARKIGQKSGLAGRTVQRYLRNLQERKKIERVGGDKGGHWEVIDKK